MLICGSTAHAHGWSLRLWYKLPSLRCVHAAVGEPVQLFSSQAVKVADSQIVCASNAARLVSPFAAAFFPSPRNNRRSVLEMALNSRSALQNPAHVYTLFALCKPILQPMFDVRSTASIFASPVQLSGGSSHGTSHWREPVDVIVQQPESIAEIPPCDAEQWSEVVPNQPAALQQ